MTCKWNGTSQPRTLANRHDDDCQDEGCRGCAPCTERHCRVCGVLHVEGIATCPGCMAETRESLDEIGRMTGDLPAEVEVHGVDGEAFVLLGPTADPEARGHYEASVLAGRIERPACGWCDNPWPCAKHADSERHPLLIAQTWAMVFRDACDHDEPTVRGDLRDELGYLTRNLTYMATFEHVPFEDFVRDLRGCVTHLERVLHDGEQIEKGAPCPTCKQPLKHVWGKRVVDDRWVCERKGCEVDGYTTAQYRGWVEDDALHNADKLTAADMARRFTDEDGAPLVTAGEVRVWGSKGYVRKRGRNDRGITLYDVSQVQVRAELRLAEHADETECLAIGAAREKLQARPPLPSAGGRSCA